MTTASTSNFIDIELEDSSTSTAMNVPRGDQETSTIIGKDKEICSARTPWHGTSLLLLSAKEIKALYSYVSTYQCGKHFFHPEYERECAAQDTIINKFFLLFFTVRHYMHCDQTMR